MRIRSPASRGSFAIRFSAFDVCWAFLSPWLALWIRGAQVLNDWPAAAFYCAISLVAALIAFLIFRTREGMTHLFSVHDALEVAKAVLVSEFVTCLVLFSVTRLEGIPRSTPLIHALLLSAGLVMARAFVRMSHAERGAPVVQVGETAAEHVVMIGSSRLSALYISLLRAYAPERFRVIAVLDDRAEMIGRSIAGVRVLGPSNHLLPVIEEFREHGINVGRVIVGGDEFFLSPETQTELERVAKEYEMHLEFVPRLIGLNTIEAAPPHRTKPAATITASLSPPSYFSTKRYLDFCVSLALIVVLLPVLLAVSVVVLLDVGSPVFFWQRRTGKNGRIFQMHKFRTLKPAFDVHGRPYATTDRMSFVGTALRKSRLDELPQLLNVLVGDMSLIGPRPLLPQDQPHNAALRLSVRPGITGWAQVNGGQLLSPAEKNALDEWYIRNASFWLDLRIVGKTILFMLSGEPPQAKKVAPRGLATVHRGQNPRSAARGS